MAKPKAKKKSTPKLPKPCAVCRVIHDGGTVNTYVHVGRFGTDEPTEYLCGKACYDVWVARRVSSGSGSAGT